MTKYQILLTIYQYLSEEFSKADERPEALSDYLSSVDPYLWTDGKSADPSYYADFMDIADTLFEGDDCSVSEGRIYAKRYLEELDRRDREENGEGFGAVIEAFSGCSPEKWDQTAEKLCENKTSKRKCACCGYYTLTEPAGGFEICPVCFWEDDAVQNSDPEFEGGANKVCLREARKNFEEFGACTESSVPFVREPDAEEISGIVREPDDEQEED